MNNGPRQNRESLRYFGGGEVYYDSSENCNVNKLVGLSCFPSLQPPGAFVCLCVSLWCFCQCWTFSCIRTTQMTMLPAREREVVDGQGVNKRSPNHCSTASSHFPSSTVSKSGQPRGDQTCL